MLKFHQRLLFLLCTIVIISFVALGAIITHVIYNTVISIQQGELEHQAEQLVSLNNHNKTDENKNIAKNENITLILTKSNNEVISTKSRTPFNNDNNNEANPSKIINDKI